MSETRQITDLLPAVLLPNGCYDVTVVFLEMPAAPRQPQAVLPDGSWVERIISPDVALYRDLYDLVGRDWHWVERKRLPDDALLNVISDPKNEVHVLFERTADGAQRIAGYYELDLRRWPVVNLSYFGLAASHIGRRMGGAFLDHAIRTAWSYGPEKLTVNTCNLDHPAALPLYQKRGFRAYAARDVIFDPSFT